MPRCARLIELLQKILGADDASPFSDGSCIYHTSLGSIAMTQPVGVGRTQRLRCRCAEQRAARRESVEPVLRTCRAGWRATRIDASDGRATLKHPFFGSRMMTQTLKAEGSAVNRKRVQRLMRLMGLESTAPKPNTSKPAPEHAVYPYLLRNLTVSRINQVWAADITYIPMARGFVYLVAVIDWYSRRVLAWRLSNDVGDDLLRGGSERSCGTLRLPRDIQHGPGLSVHRSEEFTSVLLRGRSRSAWMAKVAVSTTSSWSGSGAR